jgi:hypothetical protein
MWPSLLAIGSTFTFLSKLFPTLKRKEEDLKDLHFTS